MHQSQLTDVARHVIGWHLIPEMRGQNASDDVVSSIHESLVHDGLRHVGGGAGRRYHRGGRVWM